MRKYFSIILGSLLLSMVACTSNVDEIDPITTDPDYIVLSAKALGVTRSADTDVESTLAKIDVYVMDANFNVIHSERITPASPVVGQGQFVMKKKRNDFTEGAGYYVYMIANSTSATLPQANTWDDLLELTQEDKNIHLTGMSHVQDVDAPKYFLMDGFAYLSSEATTSAPKTMSPIIINDGDRTKKVELSGTLYRAAAKFILNISQGESVEFKQVLDNATPAYMLYQLPISTLVVTPEADARYTSTKQNTKEWGPDTNFVWTTDKNGKPQITFIGYGYANDWSKELSINETALLISIPMMWDKNGISTDGKEASSPVNWYKIPLSEQSKFERNTCYVINVNINAIGAEEQNVPVELKDIEYVTLPWQDVKLNIGDYKARYLTLNTDLVKIYDKNFDLDQLTFTSSSPIVSIKLKDVFSHNERLGQASTAFTTLKVTKESSDANTEAEYEPGDGVYAYYIDKFGQKIQLGTDPNFDIKISNEGYQNLTKDQILALENNLLKKYIRAEVPAEQKRALNGNIHIYSPINAEQSGTTSVDGLGVDDLNWNSHFNTVRYLEFEVMNEQGMTATFRVEQTPLTVISNIPGFYSYRDDHVLTDDPNEIPTHYFNYKSDFNSFMTSAMSLMHPHEFTHEPKTEAWINTPQADRNYSTWFIKDHYDFTWLQKPSNDCPPQGTGDLMWVELRYGFYTNNVTWNNGKNKGSYSGIYRVADGQRPYQNNHYFYRERYGGTGFGSMDTKGAAIGPYYEVEVEVDGVKQTRVLRDHFIWQCFPIFWSKFVGEYYDEAKASSYYSGQRRQKGQVDIHEYGPSEDGGKTWGRYTYSTNLAKYTNHRMYNILTTTTSTEYTIAYPKLNDNGEVANTHDNSKVVSPSISLASQLGETNHKQFKDYVAANVPSYIMPHIKDWYTIAKRQCDNYVETTFDDKNNNNLWDEGEEIIEYHDWRLPTKAEVENILKYQENSRSMDKVLSAQYYFCITGTADSEDISNIYNWVSEENKNFDAGNEGYYVRCVRDTSRK